MINEPLYHRTVDILVKAYVDDTLKATKCNACAVGNIIASNCGWKLGSFGRFISNNEQIQPQWQDVFCTDCFGQRIFPEKYTGEARRQIDSTGYTWQELARIEYAFETGYTGDDPMFNALMAVISVLDDIHRTPPSQSESARGRFVKESI